MSQSIIHLIKVGEAQAKHMYHFILGFIFTVATRKRMLTANLYPIN